MFLEILGVRADVMIKKFISKAMAATDLDNVDPMTAERLIPKAHKAPVWGKR